MAFQDTVSTLALNTTQHTISGSSPGQLRFPLWLTIVFAVMSGIVSLFTILGNVTVLLAFRLESKLRQPYYYFIVSLALSDLLVGVVSIPMFTQWTLQKTWPEELGSTLCDIYLIIDFALRQTSQLSTFLITLDHYLSVKKPVEYMNWRTKRKVFFMIVLAWCIAIIEYFLLLVGFRYIFNDHQVSLNQEECDVPYDEVPVFAFVWNLLNFMIFIFVMIAIYYKIALDLKKKELDTNKIFKIPTKETDDETLEFNIFQSKESRSNNCSSWAKRNVFCEESTENLNNCQLFTKEATENISGPKNFWISTNFDSFLPRLPKNLINLNGSKAADCSNNRGFASDVEKNSNYSKGRGLIQNRGQRLNISMSLPNTLWFSEIIDPISSLNAHPENKDIYLQASAAGFKRHIYHNVNQSSSKPCSLNSPKEKSLTNSTPLSSQSTSSCLSLKSIGSTKTPNSSASNSHDATPDCTSIYEVAGNLSVVSLKTTATGPAPNCSRKTISFILSAYIVCFVPYCVIVFLQSFDHDHGFVYTFMWGLSYLNSLIHPISYILTNKNFKGTFIRIMKFDWHQA